MSARIGQLLKRRLPSANFILQAHGRTLPANQVRFIVPLNYGKLQIKHYLQQIYNVRVVKVNTLIRLGTHKYVYQNKRLSRPYRRPDTKHAIVTLDQPFVPPKVEVV